ncbi:General secretion pathway protein F [hydrothermal vent metagenome]|uniref:General secretion pathway protein F n=1 Tax=hydrothermal vent metagenome TaxID=652676 RepID=A0A3B0ZEE0_9ZZZZ
MAAFEYVALDANGRKKKGILEGDSARHVRQQLREQGLLATSVDEAAEREVAQSAGFGVQRSISAADLSLITRQLATLTKSGLPLDEATATVAKQTEKPRLQRLILGIRAKILEGHSLADGMAQFPHVFNNLYRSTVAAGEQTGHLDIVLERLADYTESKQHLQSKIKMALLYPAVLIFMAITIVSFLLAYVVPEVVKVFEDSGQTLPLITRLMIAASDFLVDYYWLIILLAVAGISMFSMLYKQPAGKEKIHKIWLKLPLVGRLVRGSNTARFTRTLSILVASGVPLLEALKISGQVVENLPMRHAIIEAGLRVREGSNLAKSLDVSGYFPPIVVNLIASGEVSGNLGEMLERSSVNQEQELETLITTLMGLLEPLLLLVMGAVILMIVLAILLPIFNLNQLIQ